MKGEQMTKGKAMKNMLNNRFFVEKLLRKHEFVKETDLAEEFCEQGNRIFDFTSDLEVYVFTNHTHNVECPRNPQKHEWVHDNGERCKYCGIMRNDVPDSTNKGVNDI